MYRVNILEYYHRQAPMRVRYSLPSMFSKQMALKLYAVINMNTVAMRNRA
jgi:hypothetical protein